MNLYIVERKDYVCPMEIGSLICAAETEKQARKMAIKVFQSWYKPRRPRKIGDTDIYSEPEIIMKWYRYYESLHS